MKFKKKPIANLIQKVLLQDIADHLKRNDGFKTSLFNFFYKLLRSERYFLIDSVFRTKKEPNLKVLNFNQYHDLIY